MLERPCALYFAVSKALRGIRKDRKNFQLLTFASGCFVLAPVIDIGLIASPDQTAADPA